MEVILHIGAHRCATTSFQKYVQSNAREFARQGIVFWGPDQIRKTELRGIRLSSTQAHTQLQQALSGYQRQGVSQLLISEENFLGRMSQNLKASSLYPDALVRARGLAGLFEGWISRIVLNIRSLDAYWRSVAAYRVRRGDAPIDPAHWERVANSRRSWRHVIADLANGCPEVPVQVLPFEDYAGRPHVQMARIALCVAPEPEAVFWFNRNRTGVPLAYGKAKVAVLEATYADDLVWLASGADGLAQLMPPMNTNPGEERHADIRIDERKPT